MNIKDHLGAVSTTLSIMGAIVAGTIYVNNNFAQAADVEKVLNNQQQQIQLYSEAQRSNRIFQLEYYDDRLKKLNEEKDKAARVPPAQRRSLESIQADIDDTKVRREIVRESIIREK